jgi:hypothetical protein
MDLKIFPPSELYVVLRALRSVALANEIFTDAERDFVASIARLHGVSIDPHALDPISLEDVVRVICDPHRRKRVVQLALVMALVEGQPGEPTHASVRALADALDVPESGLKVLYEVSRGHTMLARIEMLRRMRSFTQNLDGFPGFAALALSLAGIGGTDAALAHRYHALGDCPDGSFGRAVYDHFTSNAFAFPGEKHGVGAMVFHDIGHVLSGYGTDPQHEIQQAAFQAGFSRHDGFLFLLFGILQFHLALRITPVAKGYRGLFDVNAVVRALERGAACKVDLGAGFDHFAYANEPLALVRAELGVSPP